MILLILESLNQYGERKQKFKFHYDSINSIFVSQHLTIMFHFKFHYDSIQMKKRKNNVSSNLNSIMILLIQVQNAINSLASTFKFHADSINSHSLRIIYYLRYQYLNSIMILLIRAYSSD